MPKSKTKKGMAKRFKLTKSGRVKRTQSGRSHLAGAMTPKRNRKLRGYTAVDSTDIDEVKKAYGLK